MFSHSLVCLASFFPFNKRNYYLKTAFCVESRYLCYLVTNVQKIKTKLKSGRSKDFFMAQLCPTCFTDAGSEMV